LPYLAQIRLYVGNLTYAVALHLERLALWRRDSDAASGRAEGWKAHLGNNCPPEPRETTLNRLGGAPVQSAQYFRSQAELCLELAHQMSDRKDVEHLRLAAARYIARASELESRSETSPHS
jgi:hypothetical protein